MEIDNSSSQAWWFCPLAYFERYQDGQSASSIDAPDRDFGSRMHELLDSHYLGKPEPPSKYPAVEDEAQATFAAYLGHYPQEDWEVVEGEKVYRQVIPGTSHLAVAKIDLLVRTSSGLWILDHKTERRGSSSNSQESWASRPQVSIYEWMIAQVYGEDPAGIIINKITRQSEKGRTSPSFERFVTHRTKAQRAEAMEFLARTADLITEAKMADRWPANRHNCMQGWKKCDYFQAHLTGWTDALRAKFKAQEKYLEDK